MKFPPQGSAFGDYAYVSNASDEPADVARVSPSGELKSFVDDDHCSLYHEGGWSPVGIAIDASGEYGNYLYFGDVGDDCYACSGADILRVMPDGSFEVFASMIGLARAFSADGEVLHTADGSADVIYKVTAAPAAVAASTDGSCGRSSKSPDRPDTMRSLGMDAMRRGTGCPRGRTSINSGWTEWSSIRRRRSCSDSSAVPASGRLAAVAFSHNVPP